MRSPKSRSRSKPNRSRSVGNVVNRVFESSGPEGKVRGTPQQVVDKYTQLARDAQLSNDIVAAENFLQHAEHYTRLLNAAMREMEARREQSQGQGDQGGGGEGARGRSAGGSGGDDTPTESGEDQAGGLVDTPEGREDAGTPADGGRKGGGRGRRGAGRPKSAPKKGAGEDDGGTGDGAPDDQPSAGDAAGRGAEQAGDGSPDDGDDASPRAATG